MDSNVVIHQIRARLSDVNLVSYSGGKDSTTVLQHVLAAMHGSDKKLYIVNADTLMEIPYFQTYVEMEKRLIQDYVLTAGFNAEIHNVPDRSQMTMWESCLNA